MIELIEFIITFAYILLIVIVCLRGLFASVNLQQISNAIIFVGLVLLGIAKGIL